MTYYTITGIDGSEYTGKIAVIPEEIFVFFGGRDHDGLIGLLTSHPESAVEEFVFIRRSNIRSISKWSDLSDGAEEGAPAVGDLPLADDAPQE